MNKIAFELAEMAQTVVATVDRRIMEQLSAIVSYLTRNGYTAVAVSGAVTVYDPVRTIGRPLFDYKPVTIRTYAAAVGFVNERS